MSKFLVLIILVLGSNAFAVDGVVNTTQAEKKLHTFILHQLSARTGMKLTPEMIDKKETKMPAKRNLVETAVTANAIKAQAFVNAADGSLNIKKDIIHELSVEGTTVFKNGLACNIGAGIKVSTVYKLPTTCRISVICTMSNDEFVPTKSMNTEISYMLDEGSCDVFTSRDDREETGADATAADDATAIAQ